MTLGVSGEMGSLVAYESYESERKSSGVLGDDDMLLLSVGLKTCEAMWLEVRYESL